MAIISKETFEKFSEEEKEIVRQAYKRWLYAYNKEGIELAIHEEYEELFGKENLQPEPKIKTWKDMKEEYMLRADAGASYIIDMDKKFYSEKLALKALATLQIAKLIELGYGGMITDEEWKNEDIRKFSIIRFEKELSYGEGRSVYEFISFHTPEQREKFLSYPENKKLVEQYYMI